MHVLSHLCLWGMSTGEEWINKGVEPGWWDRTAHSMSDLGSNQTLKGFLISEKQRKMMSAWLIDTCSVLNCAFFWIVPPLPSFYSAFPCRIRFPRKPLAYHCCKIWHDYLIWWVSMAIYQELSQTVFMSKRYIPFLSMQSLNLSTPQLSRTMQ